MNREKEIIKTSVVGIAGNAALVTAKIFVGIVAGSVSIITDAVNNLTDALSSVITIIGTKLAGKKPDKEHPYGHGRVEYLTSTVIAFLILFAGGSAIVNAIEALIGAEKPSYDVFSLVVVALAVVAKIALGIFFKYKGKKTESDALSSSGTDALFDSVLSFATLIAAAVSMIFKFHVEGYLAILIGGFIIKSGVEILKESISKIIGVRFDGEKAAEIKNLIMNNHPEVKGVYDLIVNNYGPNKFIASAHIEVDDDMRARELQFLERCIAGEVYMHFGIIISIGIYASNVSTGFSLEMKNYILSLTDKEPNVLQMHGFYADEQKKIVIFDIIVNFDEENPSGVRDRLYSALKEKYPDYDFNIVIDSDFSDLD